MKPLSKKGLRRRLQSTLIPLGSTAVRASPFSEDGVIRCWSKVGPTGHNSLPPGRDICGRQARLGHNHNRNQSRKKLHQRKKICHPLPLQCPSSPVDEQCSWTMHLEPKKKEWKEDKGADRKQLGDHEQRNRIPCPRETNTGFFRHFQT